MLTTRVSIKVEKLKLKIIFSGMGDPYVNTHGNLRPEKLMNGEI